MKLTVSSRFLSLTIFWRLGQSRASAHTREMDVTPSQILDVLRDIQKDVQALLVAHVADIADEIGLAVLQSGFRGNGFESLEIRPVADNKYIFWSVYHPS